MIRRFDRYEFKYLISVALRDRLIREMEGCVKPDEHDDETGYQLVSLYYDSPGLDCFWAKVEGLKFRRKVRVRIYPERAIEQTRVAMLEIKQRTAATVQKRRLALPIELAESLCDGRIGTADLGTLDGLDEQVASEVEYLSNALHLRPTAITSYTRRAFVGGEFEPGLRITFDSQLSGRVHALHVNAPAPNRLIAPADWCVMEVKTNSTIPNWVSSTLARHNCQLRRISKYCATLSKLSTLGVTHVELPLAPESGAEEDQATASE
jgi:hypothetical protein